MAAWPGPPAPAGVRTLTTPSWVFWLWTSAPPPESHMVYITAAPECLEQVCALVAGLAAGPVRPLAVRFAADPQVLERAHQMPVWAGKAVSFYLATRDDALLLAQQADALLAGQGLDGPPTLRARPFSGRSGMVFTRTALVPDHQSADDARRSRLSALLGGGAT